LIDHKKISQSYKDLKKKFQNSIETSTTLDEISQTIFNNKWTRIFLIGNAKTEKIYIQVEVSPKEEFRSLSSSVSGFKNVEEKSGFLKELLSNQIKALEHLQMLTDNEFFLEFIPEEGIWSATKIQEEQPSEKLCELISPPK
jgi:isocitrate dehydrogenase kinase/phosphatase